MQALGGQIIEYGVDFDEARAKAAEIAQQRGLYFVPAFHKDLILALQPTRWNSLMPWLSWIPFMYLSEWVQASVV
jgi:threonine dehydratase